jgi:hypothetical protein
MRPLRTASDHQRDNVKPHITSPPHAQSEYAEEIAASPAAGFIPKAQLSASAIRRLSGARAD